MDPTRNSAGTLKMPPLCINGILGVQKIHGSRHEPKLFKGQSTVAPQTFKMASKVGVATASTAKISAGPWFGFARFFGFNRVF